MSDDLGLGLRHDLGHHRRDVRPPRYGRRWAAMFVVALAVIAIIAGAAFAGVKIVHRLLASPPDYTGSGSGSVVIQVHQGDTLTDVGRTLLAKGVVRSVSAVTGNRRLHCAHDATAPTRANGVFITCLQSGQVSSYIEAAL